MKTLGIAAIFAFFLFTYFLTKSTNAQVPFPRNAPFPCTEIAPDNAVGGDPEFHSLRPYQASPCNPEVADVALFCANTLTLMEELTVEPTSNSNCKCTSGQDNCDCKIKDIDCNASQTKAKVKYEVKVLNRLAIDVSDAELPIMGNTELVTNRYEKPDPEPINDPAKVNEFVSWYLNGVIGRAEYEYLDVIPATVSVPIFIPGTGWTTVEVVVDTGPDAIKVTDYSGPLKKLLSFESQLRLRTDEIKQAYKTRFRPDLIEPEEQRHDQVVGCTFGINVPEICIPFTNTCYGGMHIGGVPVACPQSGGGILTSEWRLSDWELKDKLPPLPDPNKYNSFLEYWLKYRQWRGEYCRFIEFAGRRYFLCFQNPANPDFWGNLFPYVPFASTEDRKGEIDLRHYNMTPIPLANVTDYELQNKSVEVTQTAELYFSHMVESVELAQTLQQTYLPDGETVELNNRLDVVPPVPPLCDLKRVRSNPGDQLFPGEILADESYTAIFTCEQKASTDFFTGKCVVEDDCTLQVRTSLQLESKTPLADEVFDRLVAGPQSVFRRIFPKIGEGAPVEGIYDIPGASGISYDLNHPAVNLSSVNNPFPRDGLSPELYIPHIGSVHQYFLNCIQTALRPQGFGELCPRGEIPQGGATGGTCGEYDSYAQSKSVPPPGGGNWCDATTLKNYLPGWSDEELAIMSCICNRESGGNSCALNDGCCTGASCDFSIGLFQINALPGRCEQAFNSFATEALTCEQPGDWKCDHGSGLYCCIPLSDEGARECIDTWCDPITNIEKSKRMAETKMPGQPTSKNWCPWKTSGGNTCGADTSWCGHN